MISNTYVCSDEHYFHKNIIIYTGRKYKDVEEMNKALIDNHNAIVKSDDLVYHLGDFSMSNKVVPEILSQLNGSHILIPGNHDTCHPGNKKNKDKEATIREYLSFGFKEIHIEMEMNIPEIGLVKFNHLPYNDPTYEDHRYDHLKPKPTGEDYLFHGHVHNSWKRRGNMINVGIDVWNYRPVSIPEIVKLLKE